MRLACMGFRAETLTGFRRGSLLARLAWTGKPRPQKSSDLAADSRRSSAQCIPRVLRLEIPKAIENDTRRLLVGAHRTSSREAFMARDFREKLIRELELDLLCAPISRAVTATLVEYNRVHGTVYDFVGSGEDARGVDAIASSQRPGESALRFQVTFVDTEGRLRASIAKGESYSAEGSEQDLLDRFADSLR